VFHETNPTTFQFSTTSLLLSRAQHELFYNTAVVAWVKNLRRKNNKNYRVSAGEKINIDKLRNFFQFKQVCSLLIGLRGLKYYEKSYYEKGLYAYYALQITIPLGPVQIVNFFVVGWKSQL
jgi:hypothetical protein